MISRPVVVSPVNATLFTRGLDASGLPASTPKPFTTFRTPGGRMSSISPSGTGSTSASARPAQHNAVARGQRRSQLPRRHQDREVPRNNQSHYAQRLVIVIRHRGRIDLADRTLLRAHHPGKVAEVVHRQRHVRGHGLADRLAIVQVSMVASISRLSSIRCAILSSSRPRSAPEVLPHAALAACAASSARPTSAACDRAISHSGLPVTGVMFSK